MLDFNKLRQEQNRLENQGGNGSDNFVKLPEGEGTLVIRLLPPRKDDNLYCVTRVHKLGQKNIHCPLTLVNGRWQGICPICNHYKGLWKQSEQAKSKDESEQFVTEARAIKPAERYYYNCIVRSQINSAGEIEKDVGPKIYSIGKQVHAKIIRAILGDVALDEPELGDVTDLKTGRDFKIIKRLRKTGSETYPNYDESKFMQPSPAGTDKQIANWLENLHDLQALRMLKTTEEISRELDIYLGKVPDPSTTVESPVAEVRISEKPVQSKVSKVDSDDLPDDDFLNQLRNM